MSSNGTVALACVAGAIPADRRAAHFALIRTLFPVAQERKPLPAGYAFRFPAQALEQVVAFVVNERKCCPFLDFRINVPAGEDDVILTLSGPAGTREFLDAELPAGWF